MKTVNDRVTSIATFRFVEVRLMETAAAWTPTTPELEIKVMLGRHIWDFAQHADALGKRTFEMRRPEQFSLRPVEPYVVLLDDVRAIQDSSARLDVLYDVILPGLERRYRTYLERTDALLDEPSVTIIDRILADVARQRRDVEAIRRELGLKPARVDAWREREDAVAELVAAPAHR